MTGVRSKENGKIVRRKNTKHFQNIWKRRKKKSLGLKRKTFLNKTKYWWGRGEGEKEEYKNWDMKSEREGKIKIYFDYEKLKFRLLFRWCVLTVPKKDFVMWTWSNEKMWIKTREEALKSEKCRKSEWEGKLSYFLNIKIIMLIQRARLTKLLSSFMNPFIGNPFWA